MAKGKRRGKGEGSIYRRKDGRWVGQIENGYYPNGRRRYVRVVRSTQREVIEAMDTLTAGGRVLDGSMRLADFLDAWLGHLADGGTGAKGRPVAENTVTTYRSIVDGWIKPERIGHLRLRDVSARDIEVWTTALRRRKRKLAQSSIAKAKTMLTGALAWAVLHDKIAANPAREIMIAQKRAGQLDDRLSRDERAKVLDGIDSEAWGVAAVLGLRLGLRVGEVAGLRWSDIDFKEREVRIRRTATKTDESAGTLPLLAEVADALRSRKRHQAAERLKAGALWIETGYIITDHRGRAVSTGRIRSSWNRRLAAMGIAHRCSRCGTDEKCSGSMRRFHAGRHTTATLLLDDGVPLEVVSAICRHANLSITSDIYAKVTKDSMRRSLAKLA